MTGAPPYLHEQFGVDRVGRFIGDCPLVAELEIVLGDSDPVQRIFPAKPLLRKKLRSRDALNLPQKIRALLALHLHQ